MSFGNNIKTEKFNSDRIQLIKLNLENHAKTGNPRWYEIQVDGLKAVSKTTDVSLFDDYEMYLSDATEALRVHLFQGTSHKYDGFVFLCNTDAREQHTSLQGVGLSVEEKVAQALREKDFENAKATIEALKLELEEAKEYAENFRR